MTLFLLDRGVGHRLLEPRPAVAQRGIERNRLGERYVDRPVLLTQHAARLQQCPERLPFLLPAEQLLLVRFLLDDASVVNRHGHQIEVTPHSVDEHVDDRRQHPELRRQDLSGPAPTALDEELLSVPLADQVLEVLPEHGLVERITLEGAADEVRARAAEEGSERPKRHVDARRDVGRRQGVLVKDVRQDQVVEVAPVTRHQDDRVLLHGVDHPIQTAHLEPGKHARPDPVEEERDDREIVAVKVGGDLVEVPARLLDDFLDRHVALGRERASQFLDVVRLEHHLAHLALGAKGRAPHQPFFPIEKDLQRPRQAPHDAILSLVAVLGHERVQRNLRADRHAEVAGVPEVSHQLLHVARGLVHAVDEAREPRPFAAESRPAKDGEWHEENRLILAPQPMHDLAQVVRTPPRLERATDTAPSRTGGTPAAADEEQHGSSARRQARREVALTSVAIVVPSTKRAQPPPRAADDVPDATQPHRRHVVGEERQWQALAQQQIIDQEVVDQRPVTHDVDQRPLVGQTTQPGDVGLVHLGIAECISRKEIGEGAELSAHRRPMRLGGVERDGTLRRRRGCDLRLAHVDARTAGAVASVIIDNARDRVA